MGKLEMIISGGQTGGDQGGLEASAILMIQYGGWIPKGRLTEKGSMKQWPLLAETDQATYPPRTWRNVRDSHGTAIFTLGPAERGSALTIEFCKKQGRHWLHLDISHLTDNEASVWVRNWVKRNKIKVLNVAGNRESKSPGIQRRVRDILVKAFEEQRE